MVTVLSGRARDPAIDPHALTGMFRLRDQVFHDRLGWEVPSHGGLERDDYDDLDPVYLIARGPGRKVSGCMRLLPTVGPNMLDDTFPQLLRGEPEPRDARLWDVSRFAVAPPDDKRSASSSEVTLELVRSAIEYAFEHDIEAYVAVVSVGLERIFRRLGLPLRRFGDGRSQWVGDVRTVACRIEMNDEAWQSVDRISRRAA